MTTAPMSRRFANTPRVQIDSVSDRDYYLDFMSGAAICAMVACGEYPSVYDACDRIITYEDNVAVPNPDNRGVYEDAFGRFRETYQANKALMHKSREAVQPEAR